MGMSGLLFGNYQAQAAGGGSFTPADLTGVYVWLQSSDVATVTASGGTVSQWDDKTGNGNHAVQATGTNQFTWAATGGTEKNGLPVMVLSGNQWMRDIGGGAAGTGVAIPQPFTILTLAEITVTGNEMIATAHSSFGVAANVSDLRHDNLSDRYAMDADNLITSSGARTAGELDAVIAVYNGASSRLHLNGGSNLLSGDIGANNLMPYTIGASHTNGLQMDGYFAEFIICEGTPTNAELNDLLAYWQSVWARSYTEIS